MRIEVLPRGRRAWIRAVIVMSAIPVFVAGGCWCMFSMPGRSHRGPLPPLTAEEAALRGRLERHVRCPQALEKAARYCEQAFRDVGYAPATQPYEARGVTVRNIDADRPGASRPAELVVVGAHYDSAEATPGANDNASGVAAVLEIARAFASKSPARTVRFACFVNEEPPFFRTPFMGSRVHARRARERGEAVTGMISLETIGYFSDEAESQKYPFPFSLAYPGTGNFSCSGTRTTTGRETRRTGSITSASRG
jgi:hypothetical protein